ncbi:MAG: helix-turn-helix domain-containing protein [Candidatus Palauibacterales bacterium]|nr:helix-turn-helix domain-containing protein [Candidatus Palauibacterales bacterium]
MGERLNKAMNRALDRASMSLTTLAEEAGLHHITLRRWRMGTRNVGPDAALKVAKVLKRRSKELAKLAQKLEDIAREEAKR